MALCAHPLVLNAAAILHSPVPSDPTANQLVAFVERNQENKEGNRLPDDEIVLLLQSHVASTLPPCIPLLFRISFLTESSYPQKSVPQIIILKKLGIKRVYHLL